MTCQSPAMICDYLNHIECCIVLMCTQIVYPKKLCSTMIRDHSENITRGGGVEGPEFAIHLKGAHRCFQSSRGVPRCFQLLNITKTKIAQIKPYNTYRGLHKLCVCVEGGGIQMLQILRGGVSRFCQCSEGGGRFRKQKL